jgi:uncharacterized membrane protein
VFSANRRLAPREGLTVAVAFPRDIVSRPPPPTEAEVFWDENGYSICGWTGALICVIYFFITRRKAGKRPAKQVVIPVFKPPRNLSPASVNYLLNKMYDKRMFTATLVEMAVKGAICIQRDQKIKFKKKYLLVNKMSTEPLRPEEQEMYDTLIAGSETLDVDYKNYEIFKQADIDLEESMKKQWNIKDYFRENRGYIAVGGLLLNVFFTLHLLLTGGRDDALRALFLVSPFILAEFLCLCFAGLNKSLGCQIFIGGFLFSLLAVSTVLSKETIDVHWPSAVYFVAMSLWYIVYATRIKFFTADGARLDAELKGFKMYMKTAEEHRLNILTPPERTPELFEKLLPYAMALDVSNQWCKKFDNVLKQFNYRPTWYHNEADFSTAGFTATFTDLNTSFGSSVRKTSRGWSSGSGGRGHSGGGGGGGRGW